MFEELKVGGTYPQIAGRPDGMEINRVYQMYSSEQLASMATIRMTQK